LDSNLAVQMVGYLVDMMVDTKGNLKADYLVGKMVALTVAWSACL
jgi:hypothetical protein